MYYITKKFMEMMSKDKVRRFGNSSEVVGLYIEIILLLVLVSSIILWLVK